MAKKKSPGKAQKQIEKRLNTALKITVIGFLVLAALWIYINRGESVLSIAITLVVAAAAAALGIFLVYRSIGRGNH